MPEGAKGWSAWLEEGGGPVVLVVAAAAEVKWAEGG